jgi:hypothetical protein
MSRLSRPHLIAESDAGWSPLVGAWELEPCVRNVGTPRGLPRRVRGTVAVQHLLGMPAPPRELSAMPEARPRMRDCASRPDADPRSGPTVSRPDFRGVRALSRKRGNSRAWKIHLED